MLSSTLVATGSVRYYETFRSSETFSDLNDDDRKFLYLNSEFKTLRKFEVVYRSGDSAKNVYLLINGMIKESIDNQGKEVIRNIVHKDQLFGENSLIQESRRTSTTQSIQLRTEILQINALALRNLVSRNSLLGLKLMDQLNTKLLKNQTRLESLIIQDARTRVVSFLRENAINFGNRVGLNELLLKHNFTQQDIADFTGTSRQTVTTVLNELKRLNIINLYRKKILIRDLSLLS